MKMAERICEVSRKKQGLGRPRKSREGWASVNKRIYLSDNTLTNGESLGPNAIWQVAVACYLLTLHEQNKSDS